MWLVQWTKKLEFAEKYKYRFHYQTNFAFMRQHEVFNTTIKELSK